MPDIIVSPTTSRELLDITLSEEEFKELRKKDIPVLSVRAVLPSMLTLGQVKAAIEPIDKTVLIDPDKKHILIGTKEDSLVNTEILKSTKQMEDFFKRWVETKTLFLAFNCFHSSIFICSIKGLWSENKWNKFEFLEEHTTSICSV